MRRYGMAIGIQEERESEYRAIHSDDHPGVRDLLAQANMHNFSIFIGRLPDGKKYLFGYYEYTGDDFEADMERLSEDPRNIEWLAATDPMQIPFPGEDSWSILEPVYYNK